MTEENVLYTDELHSSANVDYIESSQDDLLVENYPTVVTPIEIPNLLELESPQVLSTHIPQILHEGKQPVAKLLAFGAIAVAIICALGSIAVPLAMLQGNLIAAILAGGCVAIGVMCLVIGAIICQRDTDS
ncbi:MAG: hypothetical protein HC787_00425 [Nostocaceae cyanobacterium CSU_2_110]|nr:hypothetical protein [Nostocaceae cyanobacterium CSU_2_110]